MGAVVIFSLILFITLTNDYSSSILKYLFIVNKPFDKLRVYKEAMMAKDKNASMGILLPILVMVFIPVLIMCASIPKPKKKARRKS